MRYAYLLTLAFLSSQLIAQKSQDEFFGLDKIWDIHLEVDREAWIKMFPKGKRTPTRMFGKLSNI